ncbi:hypothetical protein PG995_005301 [Apiospora arundinis]
MDQRTSTDTEWALDAPPPYELHSTGDILASSAAITATRSIDITFASAAPAELKQLIDRQPQDLPSYPRAPSGTSPPQANVPALNIVIQVVGSRGDVQPFIALGVALKRAGHRVRLASHNNFDQFVRDSGIEFYPIGGDPTDLMAYMVKNPGLIPSMESLRGGDIGRKRRMIKEMLHGCWLSFAHVHCAQALGVPVHIIFTMPWCATRAFPHPLANIRQNGELEPADANWPTYGVVDLMTWQGQVSPRAPPPTKCPRLTVTAHQTRRRDQQLEKARARTGRIGRLHGPGHQPLSSHTPHVLLVTQRLRVLLARCARVHPAAGFRRLSGRGPPPVYVGFGSIVLDDPARLTNVILEATQKCGVRVIISRGWSKLGGDSPSNDQVFYLGDCPHEWLFQKVSAVVHHGGAGTTACDLANSRPIVIVPFFGDQPFWANVVAAAGAGAQPIPQKEFTVERLTEALQFVLSPEANQAATKIAEQMSRENGVRTAVDSFHRWLPLDEMRCHVDHSQLARLRPKEYNTDVRRWDPVTGGVSSMLGIMTDFTSALGGTFIDPFRAYKLKKESAGGAAASLAAMKSTACGVGSMAGVVTKGAFVDAPLAFAEGFRNIPRLYGEEPKDYGKMTGWQGGGVVAAKTFGSGFYHGLTGIVTQPYKGAKEEGAMGFLKGAGKGTAGLFAKPGAG